VILGSREVRSRRCKEELYTPDCASLVQYRGMCCTIGYLRSNSQTTDEPSHRKHGILGSGRLQDTARSKDYYSHDDGVFSRELIGKVTRKECTNQSSKLQHGGHQPLPETCSGCIVRHSRKSPEELVHDEGHRNDALAVSKVSPCSLRFAKAGRKPKLTRNQTVILQSSQMLRTWLRIDSRRGL
jgi:hypothetical protein